MRSRHIPWNAAQPMSRDVLLAGSEKTWPDFPRVVGAFQAVLARREKEQGAMTLCIAGPRGRPCRAP